MLTGLVLGLAVGFTLAIPPGPVAIAVTKHGIGGHFNTGLHVGLGAALMDVVYCLLASFASSAIVVAFQALLTGNPWFPLVFQGVSAVVLVLLGVHHMSTDREAKAATAMVEVEEAQEQRARKLGYSSPVLLGVIIATTNLASPTFLPSMIAIIGYFHGNGWLGGGIGANCMFALGFGSGTLLWFFIVLRILARFRRSLSRGFISIIYRFAGGTLILLGILVAYHAATTTVWSELF